MMPENPTILLVDDDDLTRKLVVTLLAQKDYQVVEAENGVLALRYLRERAVDLVLLDVMMPEMDGFETCRRIREDMGDLLLPVVFVTALDDRESRIQGKAVGADDFLTKPVDAVELFARVDNLLKVKAYHDLRANQQQLLEEELTRTRERLIRADRLATLGTLTAGVGHELGNVATIISTARQMIEFKMEEEVNGEHMIEPRVMAALVSAENHVQTHSKHLLAYGRPGPDTSEAMDLRDVITEVLEMLRISAKTKYVAVEADLPVMVTANRTRVEQVLVNLVGNAADALAGIKDRAPTINIALRERREDRRAECAVEDNGCGIPAADLESIFDAYHTSKPPGKGTGLGLPVVQGIIRSYGGEVTVSSDHGEGSCFTFDLPVADSGPGQ